MDQAAVIQKLSEGEIVSRETIDRLHIYNDQILKWNPRINLIAKNSVSSLWFRHFYDSLQIATQVAAPETWLDVGSGGGFPALVLAAHYTETKFTLVESDQRKSTFLRQTARLMGLDHVQIRDERIEDVETSRFDVISARALADLNQLLTWLARFGNTDSQFVLPKGKNWQIELTAAEENWIYHYEAIQSETERDARILLLTNVRAK